MVNWAQRGILGCFQATFEADFFLSKKWPNVAQVENFNPKFGHLGFFQKSVFYIKMQEICFLPQELNQDLKIKSGTNSDTKNSQELTQILKTLRN